MSGTTGERGAHSQLSVSDSKNGAKKPGKKKIIGFETAVRGECRRRGKRLVTEPRRECLRLNGAQEGKDFS